MKKIILNKTFHFQSTIQQNQEQQQQFLERLMQEKQEERKKDFATLLSVLDKLHVSDNKLKA